ncbi:MAG: hypothetical protein IKY79_06595 [Bacteroidales bacterium]|nr:hypothetical protein [Bacteroidales bacterium]
MKKRIAKIMLLSVALSGTMVSCQKDDEMISSQELSQKSLAQETPILFFWIDGEEHYRKFDSQEEREEFIRHLIHLTFEGHIITIESNNKPEFAPEEKDKQTFETTNKDEMDEWAIKMWTKGYIVSINYDEGSGKITGTATLGETGTTTTAISTERDTDSM